MSISDFENLLANGSFAILFITTFFYWIQLGFFSTPKERTQPCLDVEVKENFNKSEFAVEKEPVAVPKRRSFVPMASTIGNSGLILANLQLFSFFVLRWIESHHFPLSNLYESLLFLAWSLTLGHFLIPSKVASGFMVGAITAPSALFVDAFASLTLPENLKAAAPLVPALQSNWLMMHVTMMIVSYSLLILGSLFSIAILFLSLGSTSSTVLRGPSITTSNAVDFEAENFISSTETSSESDLTGQAIESGQLPIERLLNLLDNLSYRTLGFGFPLLTIGILSGAVWANQAWGSYWSWDPKETWALITWVVFAIYFHFRFNKKWSGKKPAIVASIGFIFLWVCYLGVNLLGKGLHSYGWFA